MILTACQVWRVFSGFEKLGEILAKCPIFCLLIPLSYHICCKKWFLLAGMLSSASLALVIGCSLEWRDGGRFPKLFCVELSPPSGTKGRNAFLGGHYPQGLPLPCLWKETEQSSACVWQKCAIESFHSIQR